MLNPEQAKSARASLALSQSDVAATIGINRTYISLFEAGKYSLDDEAQSKLRALYEERGFEFNDSANSRDTQSVRTRRNNEHSSPDTEVASPASTTSRLQQAAIRLQALQSVATDTGLDSKRTAAETRVVREALSQLDYPELLAVAKLVDAEMDGFPMDAEFRGMPLAEKEPCESRAGCLLICSALYGNAWSQSDWRVWQRIAQALTDERLIDEGDCPRRPFFGGRDADEIFVRRSRACLAPAIVRSAELRRAPSLHEPQGGGRHGMNTLFGG